MDGELRTEVTKSVGFW